MFRRLSTLTDGAAGNNRAVLDGRLYSVEGFLGFLQINGSDRFTRTLDLCSAEGSLGFEQGFSGNLDLLLGSVKFLLLSLKIRCLDCVLWAVLLDEAGFLLASLDGVSGPLVPG